MKNLGQGFNFFENQCFDREKGEVEKQTDRQTESAQYFRMSGFQDFKTSGFQTRQIETLTKVFQMEFSQKLNFNLDIFQNKLFLN